MTGIAAIRYVQRPCDEGKPENEGLRKQSVYVLKKM